ncbi:MAG: ABC transporter substrate-binding protein [Actinobacteria bacterium]|nr:ABC transporter substrate-binding protein [Actinomycetota bacterium]
MTLLHGIKGTEEQDALQQMVDAFEKASGNTVEVEASPDFETVVVARVTGDNAPDVALYPQPGLLKRVVDGGGALSFDEAGIDLGDQLVPGMAETGTFDGSTYGVVVKLNIKSLLWYAKDDFEAEGYEVPKTWDELVELTDTISATGTPAWCIGIESDEATGWVATDWIEDIMLRLHGPEVKAAFEEMGKIWLNEANVLGGPTGIIQTPFGASTAPLFDDPPGCYLHRQAGFITGEFPDTAKVGKSVEMAYLPGNDTKPVLFAGDLAAVHTDNEVAAEFIEFAVSKKGQEAWLGHEGAGALAVRKDFDASKYPNESLAAQGEILAGAEFARFDGSDLMPGEVGAGAFWSEVVAWVGGQDLDTTLKNIDAAWPKG